MPFEKFCLGERRRGKRKRERKENYGWAWKVHERPSSEALTIFIWGNKTYIIIFAFWGQWGQLKKLHLSTMAAFPLYYCVTIATLPLPNTFHEVSYRGKKAERPS